MITPRRIAPTMIPGTLPEPPYAEAPPMKHDAIASISYELPILPSTEPIRDATRSPEKPASTLMRKYAQK